MRTRHISTISLFLLFCNLGYGQKKFKVEVKDTGTWRDIYCLIDEQGNLIRQLDTSKYYVSFNNDQYAYFAIFGKKGSSGWTAIDANENELFKVYNTSFGEPSPDYLIENMIRIIDENEKIGFANIKGEIIIRPQFEIATSFHNGKAIIGKTCKKVPWNDHPNETGCNHYSIACKKHGYINATGVTLKIGDYSFEQIKKEINWEMQDE